MHVKYSLVFSLGSKYQKLQESEVADAVDFQQSAPSSVNRHAPTEQPDGIVVFNAFLDANCLLLPLRLQRVVLQPADRHG